MIKIFKEAFALTFCKGTDLQGAPTTRGKCNIGVYPLAEHWKGLVERGDDLNRRSQGFEETGKK